MSAVVQLPGAAPRKVTQRSVKAVREYKRANPWPGAHEFGPMRAQRIEAERKAAILLAIEPTPVLLIVHAMLAKMTEDQRLGIMRQMAGGIAAGNPAHMQALTLIQTASMTVGDQYDLYRAMDKLRGEAGQ